MKFIILGANGQLGKEISKQLKTKKNIKLHQYSKKQLNILNEKNLYKKISSINPDVIVLCAAYTNVDRAEIEKKICKKINFESIKFITKLCNKNNILLVYYSTDYVFNGKKKFPYKEDDIICPINYYGKSKAMAENYLAKFSNNYLIFRTSRIFSKSSKNNFFYKIISKLNTNKILNVVNDQSSCIISTKSLAKISIKIILKLKYLNASNKHKIQNIFHISSKDSLTFYENAKIILSYLKKMNPKKYNGKLILPIKSKLLKQLAKRPKKSSFNVSKTEKLLKIKLPNYNSEIRNFFYNDL